ncbi:hypothetical protein [Arcobacter roscoffensis]|uniref:Uncharacterized protein n=1 Tax=Arcobacter roscoffensis TaxID=2961520 RepID=A0ABY5E3E7_9BACT|nr:hypothetical protein [Arcobacter roscoffensis]UTJ05273.1 hypothetical protein NJU99_08320 [Arcobacter roscoffensis]
MNVSETSRAYTGYVNQTNSTSKSQDKNEDFSTLLNSVSNKEENNTSQTEDLLNVQSFKNMSPKDRMELKDTLVEKYGEKKGGSYHYALRVASKFNNKDMQSTTFDNLSKMSVNDISLINFDMHGAIGSYLSGNELKASYSINLDKNGQVDYGSVDSKDVENYFNNISSEEFKYLFSTLKNSHESLAKTVGIEQSSKYSKVYENILSSYNSYVNSSKSKVFYG